MERVSSHFETGEVRKTVGGTMIPISYDFWKPLIDYFIKRCNKFRIDCWYEEVEGIQRAQLFGESVQSDINNMKIFEGQITEQFIKELIEHPFDKEGKIKWFSIFFMNDKDMILSSEHYGSEFSTGWITDEDIEFIRCTIPKEFCFHTFKEDEFVIDLENEDD
ncbi:hypothetical protein [Marinisporobacter balticus]|uniref:Uncharacterized protein n=1 Tax=Marinisporobacter balticus TaxID=2018667 RepID=A0A4R2KC12_9FIRM|nr:hypothetical protein [Marinisporobacter balticus]TCO67709.1 hypothetical protein EV214_1613 [Marinisporobacter balticus]